MYAYIHIYIYIYMPRPRVPVARRASETLRSPRCAAQELFLEVLQYYPDKRDSSLAMGIEERSGG